MLLALGFGCLLIGYSRSLALADGGRVDVINIDGAIDGVSARYLERGIDKATADGAQMLVVKLDTPGGRLDSTRDMVQDILDASVPVAVYVSPPGAQAASAGTFIAAAANFAVMAPGTNIGAASPVASGGKDLSTTIAKKVNEDTTAFIRSIAEKRQRNAQALEETVTLARSYSSTEAVESRVVDLVAADLNDLLRQLDGRTAETAAGATVLDTGNASIREINPNLFERLLGVLADQNVAFVLLVIGGLGILVELTTPGFVGPGVVGVIALALSFVGMGQLPVNWIGVGLILFSMVLFFLELQQAGLGIFGIGGIVSLVLGAFLLFGDVFSTADIPLPSFGVSVWLISVVGLLCTAFLLLFLYLARTTGPHMGYVPDSRAFLIGQPGVAVSDLRPSGTVQVGDDEWTATTDPGDLIREGEQVKVDEVYGDVLKVSRYTSIR